MLFRSLGTSSIRRRIDRLPIGRFFQLSSLLFAAVDLFWLGLVSDAPAFDALAGDSLLLALAACYFTFGAAVGISNSTHFTYLPELSGEEKRPIAVAVFTSVHGMVAGLAPIAWGLLLKQGDGGLGINLSAFLVYLGAGLALSLVLIALFARLPDTRAGISSTHMAG